MKDNLKKYSFYTKLTMPKKASIPEDDAQKAAIALSKESSATKEDIEKLDRKMIEMNGEIKILKWMIGLVIAINAIPLLKELINHYETSRKELSVEFG